MSFKIPRPFNKIIWYIFLPFIAINILAIVVIFALSIQNSQNRMVSQAENQLMETAKVLGKTLDWINPEEADYFQKKAIYFAADTKNRITIIDQGGIVLGDSHYNPKDMDNHLNRPEITAAMKTGSGKAVRQSDTLDEELIYYAMAIINPDGSTFFFRMARPIQSINSIIANLSRDVGLICLIAILIAGLLSYLISSRIIKPIKTIEQALLSFDEDEPPIKLQIDHPVELKNLSDSLYKLSEALHRRFQSIQKRKSELSSILSNMIEAVILLDQNKKVRKINRAAALMLGLKKKQAKGRSLLEMTRSSRIDQWVDEIINGASIINESFMYQSNPIKHIQINGIQIKDSRKSILLVLNDVTKTKKLENMRKEFVSNVSHELRTPITSIKGYLETIRDMNPNDQENRSRFVEICLKQTNRLTSIIEDLFLLAKIESQSEIEIEKVQVNLILIIKNAVQICNKKALPKNITIHLDLPEKIIIEGHQLLLEQAFINIIENSIKYSHENKNINIKAEMEEDKVQISFKDQGFGIAQKHLERIFERFYVVDKSRSRELGGTGLGLSITKHIIMAHKGEILISSQEGYGTTIICRLPA
ncbi:MAG: PAS domain S-box protein [Spirochaetales bacterium]|nr:PAS domain S-box protein [Spirochaetales bacterium]